MIKIKTTGVQGEYDIVKDYDVIGFIRRCSWDNASTDGINSPRPYWIVQDHELNGPILFEATTKRDCVAWAKENLA